MPLASKSSGKDVRRPGITQSHRGRLVRNAVIAGVALAFGFMMVSNALSPEEETLSVEEQQEVEFEMQTAANKTPRVEAAPANPFDMLRVAELPAGFEGDASHSELLATAEGTAQQVSTYSSKQTPEAYVETVEGIDDSLRTELLASSEASWPEIEKANISVKGTDAGVDPIIRSYNEESMLATVEVVVKQTISYPDGTSTSQTRGYMMNLVGTEQDDDRTTWTVGGFQRP